MKDQITEQVIECTKTIGVGLLLKLRHPPQEEVFFVSVPEPSIATALGMFGLATLSRRKKVSFTRYN